MKKALALVPVLALILAQNSKALTRYNSTSQSKNGVSLTLADPSGSVYQQGESVSLAVRTDSDAYVLVFDIDTEGFVSLLYPRQSNSFRRLSADETLEIPQASDASLRISGMTGMEFVFALSVANQDAISEREVASLLNGERLPFHKRFRIDGDPFLAANRVAQKLVRGVRYDERVSLAYTYFFVNSVVDHPRYLCENCYASGEDPYAEDMPDYQATAAFDSDNHLDYPLAPAFERRFTDNLARPEGYDDGGYAEDDETTTRVYGSYYPSWSHYYGYPGYLGYNYYPYYPYYYGSGFYWSVGFAFGRHHHYPFGHYYSYPYYHGGHGHHGHHGGESIAARSLRLKGKVRHKSALHEGMSHKNTRVRYKTTTVSRKFAKSKSRSVSNRVHRKAIKRGDPRPFKKVVRSRGSRGHAKKHVRSSRSHRGSRSHAVKGKSGRHGRSGRHAVKRSHSKRVKKTAAGRSGHRGKSRSVKTHRRSTSKAHRASSGKSGKSSKGGGRGKKR